MADKKVLFEGKIIVKEPPGAKQLMTLLEYLTKTHGFTIKKFEADELKLTKSAFINEHEDDVEITKSNVTVEIEIEASDDELEIEVKSESLDTVRDLTNELASRM